MRALSRLLMFIIVVGLLLVIGMHYVPPSTTEPKPLNEPAAAITVERGELVMRAANCMSCHTASGGEPFAGGLAVASPLGTIYSTNITPDDATGIGTYSLAEFRHALYDGIRQDGQYIYPAMPYENYRYLSEADVRSLYKYFMEKVTPVNNTPPQTDLKFPFNQRWGLRLWNAVALKDPDYKQVSNDEMINRGGYLVQAAGHCAACHSPRDMFFAQKGIADADDDYLTGGELNGWSIPDLRGPDSVTARWSVDQMAHYLASGRNAHATSVGEMAEVVGDSLQYLPDNDLMAIAAYLKDLSGSPEEGTLQAEQDASDEASDQATDTEKLLVSADPDMPLGARLYLDNCIGCHFADGKGAEEIFPALDGNVLVTATSPVGLIDTVLHGAELPSTKKRPARLRMQGYDWRLDDEEVAELVSFIRSGWHNDADKVTARQVVERR